MVKVDLDTPTESKSESDVIERKYISGYQDGEVVTTQNILFYKFSRSLKFGFHPSLYCLVMLSSSVKSCVSLSRKLDFISVLTLSIWTRKSSIVSSGVAIAIKQRREFQQFEFLRSYF